METVSYGGWEKCGRLSNGMIELLVTQEVGPRIIRLGFVGEENLFKEIPGDLGKTGGENWRLYGGHRLWHAPEAIPRTYFPDNVSVAVAGENNILVVTQGTETTTGIQKKMVLEMSGTENRVKVTQELYNQNFWEVECAAWALSVMKPGGMAIIPQESFVAHTELLTPVRPLALWGYTDMSDDRWRWGKRYVTLKQRPEKTSPTKVGFGNTQEWVAYSVNRYLFVVLFHYQDGSTYPDFGSSTELFTNSELLEVETLSPLKKITPGQALQHVENWFLFPNVPVEDTDESIDCLVLPLVEKAMASVKNR
ncbi:MAG: hypothetical protein NTX88_06990 [Candidatus Atribacteria bacterium]|nr:hypothetical protein [Candidatus Atribacteria bacterium]